MKGRRFKMGVISMDVVSSWGKALGQKIQEAIPPGSKVIKHDEEFETASLLVLIYHDDFEVLPEGVLVPRVVLELTAKEESLIQTVN